jgi:hypothetical protein
LNFGALAPQISGSHFNLGWRLIGQQTDFRQMTVVSSERSSLRSGWCVAAKIELFTLFKVRMTDYLGLNIETLSRTFRKQASGMRLLADEILDGEFRRGLLVLARDYDLKAEGLEGGKSATPVRRRRQSRRAPTVRLDGASR